MELYLIKFRNENGKTTKSCFSFFYGKGKSSLGGKYNAHYVIKVIESTKCSSIASIFDGKKSNKERGKEGAIKTATAVSNGFFE